MFVGNLEPGLINKIYNQSLENESIVNPRDHPDKLIARFTTIVITLTIITINSMAYITHATCRNDLYALH